MDLNTSKVVVALISRNYVPNPENMGLICSSIFINQFQSILNANKYSLDDILEYRKDFSDLFDDLCYLRSIDLIQTQHVKDILEYGWSNPYFDLVSYFVSTKILDVIDESILKNKIKELISSNQKLVDQIKNGKPQIAGSFIGMLKKEFGNKFNPQDAMTLIQEEISKS